MQSYIMTYHRLRNREPLIALDSHRRGVGVGGWALISACAVLNTTGKGGAGETDLNTLPFYSECSESSGILYHPQVE